MNLIVTDSNAKAITLGGVARNVQQDVHWITTSVGGFSMDFPKGSLGIDLDTYEPKLSIRNWNGLKNILLKAIDADHIFIVTDDDPRGEFLAHHVANNIYQKFPEKIARRLRLRELTATALEAALRDDTPINRKIVEAHEVRMVMDRLVSFKLSQGCGYIVGRAMLPVLKILDGLGASSSFHCSVKFEGAEFLSDPLGKTEAMKVAHVIGGADFSKDRREYMNSDIAPPSPLSTDDLICEGTSILRVRGSEVMTQARNLYETGYITDPAKAGHGLNRTFFNSVLEKIRSLAGSDYCARSYYSVFDDKNECVRPVDMAVYPSTVPVPVRDLYRLIWSRTMGSCSIPTTIRREFVSFEAAGFTWKSVGSQLVVDGYRRVEAGAPTKDLCNIPKPLVFKDAEVVERCDLTEGTLQRAVRAEIPDVGVAFVVRALENNDYVMFKGMNVTITSSGRALLSMATENMPEMLWPAFLVESDARIKRVEQGTLSRHEALDDYRRWIDEKIL